MQLTSAGSSEKQLSTFVKKPRNTKPKSNAVQKTQTDRTRLVRKSRVIGPRYEKRVKAARKRIAEKPNIKRGISDGPVRKNNSTGDKGTSDNTGPHNGGRARVSGDIEAGRGHRGRGGGRPRVVYHDRPDEVRHYRHYEHTYRDYHHRLRRRIIWPGYRYMVRYDYGPYFNFRYVYPYYHRKYLFVSLGGWWPTHYSYARYYWYGYHPWRWYGYYPLPSEVRGPTYNYYTYNYYDSDGTAGQSGESANGIVSADEDTFADVREKLASQSAEQPEEQTLADTYFENGVKAFEKEDYASAASWFAKAMDLAEEDVIIPFAYSQALLAGERYTDAAHVLKAALEKVEPEKKGVFYPRGLYTDEEKLLEHISRLSEQVDSYSFRTELQLLLGFQLLGAEQTESAAEHLQKAGENPEYAAAAKILLDLLEKVKAEEAESDSQ